MQQNLSCQYFGWYFDVSNLLQEGDNLIAVHTLYQGLINRVWQSGDNRHGLILDLDIDGKTAVSSDQTFRLSPHTAYSETGICGYDTQFLERYDSGASEVGFEQVGFDDRYWKNAEINQNDDHILVRQKSGMLEFEKVFPIKTEIFGNRILYDFGSNYVGYLVVKAEGKKGDLVTVRCAQELNDDGSLRYKLRANCTYEEGWILAEGESILDWYDYKSFRYAELSFPKNAEIKEVYFLVRHYPFELKGELKPEYRENQNLKNIWELCVNTQKYGVQEVIQDCMEREKGFYLGDGCYTALTNMILTGDDSMVRKLIDDAFSTEVITDTLVTCMCCSFMQEIAEYPLGLDRFGGDVLSKLIWGAQASLLIGVISTAIGLAGGALLGLIAGTFGGWVDNVVMRFVDILLSVPNLLLAVSIAAVLGQSQLAVMIAIGASQVPIFARLLRASMLQQRSSDYVLSAQTLGLGRGHITMSHVLPNSVGPVIVQGTLTLATAVIDAAALSFLGLGGGRPETAEWGRMLTYAQAELAIAPWLAFLPGICIAVTALGFTLLGESLREAMDPRTRAR